MVAQKDTSDWIEAFVDAMPESVYRRHVVPIVDTSHSWQDLVHNLRCFYDQVSPEMLDFWVENLEEATEVEKMKHDLDTMLDAASL